jgi:hypothetical protein
LLQVDGREIAIDHNDGEISQGRGGEILEQELLRPKAVHQEAKTAPAAEHYIHSLRSVFERSPYYPPKFVSKFTFQPLILSWFNFHTYTLKTVQNTPFH